MASITRHPGIDTIVVDVAAGSAIDPESTWYGGYLSDRILMLMPTTPYDRVQVAIAKPSAVLTGDNPEERVLRALLGDSLVGAMRGILSAGFVDRSKDTKVEVSVSQDDTTRILQTASDVVRDIQLRDYDFGYKVDLAQQAGIAHNPLHSVVARTALSSPYGVIVPDGDMTVDDIASATETPRVTILGPDGFPQRQRLIQPSDVPMPPTPNTPGDLDAGLT